MSRPRTFEGWASLCAEVHDEWQRRTGIKPTWNGRDYSALHRLMKAGVQAEEVRRRWLNYLDSPDPFLQAQGWSLRFFAEHFDSFAFGPVNARESTKDAAIRRELKAGGRP
jgi:hypothetical protein